jgi:hypothetical protein
LEEKRTNEKAFSNFKRLRKDENDFGAKNVKDHKAHKKNKTPKKEGLSKTFCHITFSIFFPLWKMTLNELKGTKYVSLLKCFCFLTLT